MLYFHTCVVFLLFFIITITSSAGQISEGSDAFAPSYQPTSKLADALLINSTSTTVDANGKATIEPKGKAIYAIRGKINMKDSYLQFTSSGALKLRLTQLGFDDTIQLGEPIIFDELETNLESKTRRAYLTAVISHHPNNRGWKFPHFTADNIFFVTISPVGDNSVSIEDLTLYGAELQQTKPYLATTVNTEKTNDFDAAGYYQIYWEKPTAASAWFNHEKQPLVSGSVDTFANIPFKLSPTVLNSDLSAFTVPVNQKCGTISLLHVAGKQPAKANPLVAACQIIYDDDSTETIFFVLRWNAGVYRDNYLERGKADFSWWGPVGYSKGQVHYLPRKASAEAWNAIYRTNCYNPQPDKNVKALTFYQFPGDTREFAILGITLRSREASQITMIEPERAVFTAEENLSVSVFKYSAVSTESINNSNITEKDTQTLFITKTSKAVSLGEILLQQLGNFTAGLTTVTIPDNEISPGPVAFICGDRQKQNINLSDTFGLMPKAEPKSFQYVMIAGGGEAKNDWELIYRLGYDAVKIHLPWVEEEEGKVEFPGWDARLQRIVDSGLKIEIRNHIRTGSHPEYFKEKAEFVKSYSLGQEPQPNRRNDPADPYAVSRLVNLYRKTAEFAKDYPVISINANYGLRTEMGVKRQLIPSQPAAPTLDIGQFTLNQFREQLTKEFTLAEINAKTGLDLTSFEQITPTIILADQSRFFLPCLVRLHNKNLANMQRQVAAALRDTGYQGHLTFNTSFHITEQKLIGANTGEYLRLGRDFPPASLYHETSDRYCLSFAKWLLAKRTLDLPFGDEGNQNPPTYEHCILAYHWMAMMQCYDALYCQWFGGKPASQNLAWIKPFHSIIYNADYLPDPVSLAICLDSGAAEAPEINRNSLHTTTRAHYGLANILRELNINADRYMIDEFPELDSKITTRLLIDDINRSITPEFAQRLDKFINVGGVYLATLETDGLNNNAFLRQLGLDLDNITSKSEIQEKSVGAGKIVLLPQGWPTDSWDTGHAPEKTQLIGSLLLKLGDFLPLVQCDTTNVFVTPYRDTNGDLLLHVINITAKPQQVTISIRNDLGSDKVLDHRTEIIATASEIDNYLTVNCEVPILGATVLRVLAEK